jgi:hypothetical protein
MKLNLAVALTMLGASAALASAPLHVAGDWKPQRIVGVAGFSSVTFTPSGEFLVTAQVGARNELVGSYQVLENKVVAHSKSGETYTFEAMSDGRLCVYPPPGAVLLGGG